MKKPFKLTVFFLLGLLVFPVISNAQLSSTTFVSVEGEVLSPLKLSLEDFLKMNPYEVKSKDMQGKERTFKGVRLLDVLDLAGVTLGKELRGENLTKSLLFTAADGYEVVFALAEIDSQFTDQVVLIAYEMDGKPLPQGDGPFRIIAPEDKRPARWIRELSSIKVLFPKD